MVKLIKNTEMATSIREEIALLNSEGKPELIFYTNISGGVTITQEDPLEAPYFCVTMTKQDWEEIKEFIDGQLNQ